MKKTEYSQKKQQKDSKQTLNMNYLLQKEQNYNPRPNTRDIRGRSIGDGRKRNAATAAAPAPQTAVQTDPAPVPATNTKIKLLP